MKISAAGKKKTQGYENGQIQDSLRYQDIAKKFETAAKGKKTEKQSKETLQTIEQGCH